jgi:hypothetical protein
MTAAQLAQRAGGVETITACSDPASASYPYHHAQNSGQGFVTGVFLWWRWPVLLLLRCPYTVERATRARLHVVLRHAPECGHSRDVGE